MQTNIINRIKESVNINTVLGLSIINGLNDEKVNDKDVLLFIKEQAIDNPSLMKTVLNEELVSEIMAL